MSVITSLNESNLSLLEGSNPLELEECITLLSNLQKLYTVHKFSKYTLATKDLNFVDVWSNDYDNSRIVAYKCIQKCASIQEIQEKLNIDCSKDYEDVIQDCLPSIDTILSLLNLQQIKHNPEQTFIMYKLYKLNAKRLFSLYKKVIREYKNDAKIEQIKQLLQNKQDDKTVLTSIAHQGSTQEIKDEYRTSKRVQDLINFVGNRSFRKILDYGGGSGDLAHFMKGYWNCEAYCIDIKNWFSKEHTTRYEDVNYVFIDDNSLPFEDNSFDCISIIQVIHHLDNPVKTCKELSRILSSDGVLFVREHNCDNYEDKLTIDLEHLLYETGRLDVDWRIMSTFEACYMNKKALRMLLEECGFIFLKDELSHGVTNCYYSLWKKL